MLCSKKDMYEDCFVSQIFRQVKLSLIVLVLPVSPFWVSHAL